MWPIWWRCASTWTVPVADESETLPRASVHWPRSFRIIPARFPPVALFEGVAGDSADLEALNELEGLTSNRLREKAGEIHLLNPEDRRFGPGWSPIMAAVCYPRPSRFTDGRFGVYYCADNERSAVAETRFHRERFMAESGEPPMALEMRVYITELYADLVDLRQDRKKAAPYLDPQHYEASQRLGMVARGNNHYGLVYPSVRDPQGGECAAIFRPPALSPAHQGKHLQYRWDGQRIVSVLELRQPGY